MIISDEQAHLAALYLQSNPEACAPLARSAEACGVTAELIERIQRQLALMPETRSDRVESARARLGAEPPHEEIAAKMIGRAISDSLR
jgi:hypothetical protein